MPSCLRLIAALVTALILGVACSQPERPRTAGSGSSTSSGGEPDAALAEGTCWTGELLGADPQDVLRLSRSFGVPYPVAARALASRPAFEARLDCRGKHAVEVYKVVRLPKLNARLNDYATLLRTETRLYADVARRVAGACMTGTLAKAVAKTGLPGAVMAPVLPAGTSLSWAPASPDQWGRGQRLFACTLTWREPDTVRYRTVFTRKLATSRRTCIDSKALVFVDCARRHDRERIAVIEARDAVAAGALPGPKGIRQGPNGRYVEVSDAILASLDAACTAYLRAISTTTKLGGVANIDVDEWPAPEGSFRIYCDADTRPEEDPLVTKGSVYNRS